MFTGPFEVNEKMYFLTENCYEKYLNKFKLSAKGKLTLALWKEVTSELNFNLKKLGS